MIKCPSGSPQHSLGTGAACGNLFQTDAPLSCRAGDGQLGDPRRTQHPHGGGPGRHRHQLVRGAHLSGLPGPRALPPLEEPPAGVVRSGRAALLAPRLRHSAQLRAAGTPGGVSQGACACACACACVCTRGRGDVRGVLCPGKGPGRRCRFGEGGESSVGGDGSQPTVWMEAEGRA